MKSAQPEQGFLIKGRVDAISEPRCFYKPEEERQKHRRKIIFLNSFQKGILFRFPLTMLQFSFLLLHGFSPLKAVPLNLCINVSKSKPLISFLHLSLSVFKVSAL